MIHICLSQLPKRGVLDSVASMAPLPTSVTWRVQETERCCLPAQCTRFKLQCCENLQRAGLSSSSMFRVSCLLPVGLLLAVTPLMVDADAGAITMETSCNNAIVPVEV